MTDPIPVRGDRAAWDDIGYPELHSKDLDLATPVHHLPSAAVVGYVPNWDGSKWISGPVNATWIVGYPITITDIANADGLFYDDGYWVNGPVNAVSIAGYPVTLTGITNGDTLLYQDGVWVNGEGSGGATAFSDLTDVPAYAGNAKKLLRINAAADAVEAVTAETIRDVVTITSTHTLGADENYALVDPSITGSFALGLPPVAGFAGKIYRITRTDAATSGEYVAIDPDGAETINGQTSLNLVWPYETVTLLCTGSEWIIAPTMHVTYQRFRAVNGPATVSLTDADVLVIVNSTGGAVTLNLPSAGNNYTREYKILKVNVGGSTITLDGYSTETINGSTTYLLTASYESVTIVSNGSNWNVLNEAAQTHDVTLSPATATRNIIQPTADVPNLIFKPKWSQTADLTQWVDYAGTVLSAVDVNGNLILADNISSLFGTGSDLEIFHNGTNSFIQNNTGNIIIENDASDKDIIFKVNDGGVDTTLMTLDASVSRVGILIAAPTQTLDVNGIVYGRDNALFGYVAGSSGGFLLTKTATYGLPAVQAVTSAYGGSDIMINPAGGNVALGNNATPAEKLDVTGNANVSGAYMVDGVQVVGNRVIDARADDVVDETWGAVDAGVLDAVRDCLIAHGLLAAA